MTALEFGRKCPELAYLGPIIETYCQGGPGTILSRIQAADASEGPRLHEATMRLLADGARDLQRLDACIQSVAAEDRSIAELVGELVRALLPVKG